jgi:hypothetical protein
MGIIQPFHVVPTPRPRSAECPRCGEGHKGSPSARRDGWLTDRHQKDNSSPFYYDVVSWRRERPLGGPRSKGRMRVDIGQTPTFSMW